MLAIWYKYTEREVIILASNNTRERLIETAIDLIWKSSYGSVSVDDICKTADVKKGSFYHYFPSKIDLAIAAMDTAFAEFKPMLDEIFSPATPPIERFKKYIVCGYEHQQGILEKHGIVCGCPMASLASEMAPQDQSIHDKTDEIIGYKMKYYESTLREMVAEGSLPKDTDIEAKAQNIYSFIMGQFVMARIQNSLKPLKPEIVEDGLFSIMGADEKALKGV